MQPANTLGQEQANGQGSSSLFLEVNTHEQNFNLLIDRFQKKHAKSSDDRIEFKEFELISMGLRGINSDETNGTNTKLCGKTDDAGDTFLNYVIDKNDDIFPTQRLNNGTEISTKLHYIEKILNGIYKTVTRTKKDKKSENLHLERIRNVISAQNIEGDTALHKAIRKVDQNNNFDLVELLLKSNEELPIGEKPIADTTIPNTSRVTPIEMLKDKIEATKMRSLKTFIQKGHHSILKTLLENEGYLNEENKSELLKFALDLRPLTTDLESKKINMVELLLNNGAIYYPPYIKATTKLESAVEQGAMELTKILISRGTQINTNVDFGNLLTRAAKNGRSEMFNFLADKEYGPDKGINIAIVPQLLSEVIGFGGRLGPRQCHNNDKYIESKFFGVAKKTETENIVNRIFDKHSKYDLQNILTASNYDPIEHAMDKKIPEITQLIATKLDQVIPRINKTNGQPPVASSPMIELFQEALRQLSDPKTSFQNSTSLNEVSSSSSHKRASESNSLSPEGGSPPKARKTQGDAMATDPQNPSPTPPSAQVTQRQGEQLMATPLREKSNGKEPASP